MPFYRGPDQIGKIWSSGRAAHGGPKCFASKFKLGRCSEANFFLGVASYLFRAYCRVYHITCMHQILVGISCCSDLSSLSQAGSSAKSYFLDSSALFGDLTLEAV